MTCQGGGGHKGSTIWHFFSVQVKKYLGKASLIFSNRGGGAQKKSKLLTHMHSGHRERERKVGGVGGSGEGFCFHISSYEKSLNG